MCERWAWTKWHFNLLHCHKFCYTVINFETLNRVYRLDVTDLKGNPCHPFNVNLRKFSDFQKDWVNRRVIIKNGACVLVHSLQLLATELHIFSNDLLLTVMVVVLDIQSWRTIFSLKYTAEFTIAFNSTVSFYTAWQHLKTRGFWCFQGV